jgi:VanZ family protein
MRWLWVWGPALAQMAAIFVLSSQPDVPSLPGGLTNHTGHLVGYAILSVLLLRALAGARWVGVTAWTATLAAIASALYGVTDEWHQTFVPGRDASAGDLVADAAGAVIGVTLVLLWRRHLAGVRQSRAV